MKQTLTFLLLILAAHCYGQDTTTHIIKIDTARLFTTLYDPCTSKSVYWAMTYSECPDTPLHCWYCQREIKELESFAYVIVKKEKNTKYADFIHVRCANERIEKAKAKKVYIITGQSN